MFLVLPCAHSGLLRMSICNWLELAVALGKGGPVVGVGVKWLSAANLLSRAFSEVGLVREVVTVGEKNLRGHSHQFQGRPAWPGPWL